MATQVENGKAFEWAVARELARQTGVPLQHGPTTANAEACYNKVGPKLQARFDSAARLSVTHILERESNNSAVSSPRKVEILPDGRGQVGDVRDVVLFGTVGELGISCKSNHSAFKHSRLSARLDFVKKWGLSKDGMSSTYKQAIAPIFKRLADLRAHSQGTAKWHEIDDVMREVYQPILNAFTDELERVAGESTTDSLGAANALLTYFVGNHDFYKVIARADHVLIQAFNFQGTLAGRRSKGAKSGITVDPARELNARSIRIGNYIFHARIHNASSKIEASLKFDIQADALPPEDIYTHTIVYRSIP